MTDHNGHNKQQPHTWSTSTNSSKETILPSSSSVPSRDAVAPPPCLWPATPPSLSSCTVSWPANFTLGATFSLNTRTFRRGDSLWSPCAFSCSKSVFSSLGLFVDGDTLARSSATLGGCTLLARRYHFWTTCKICLGKLLIISLKPRVRDKRLYGTLTSGLCWSPWLIPHNVLLSAQNACSADKRTRPGVHPLSFYGSIHGVQWSIARSHMAVRIPSEHVRNASQDSSRTWL